MFKIFLIISSFLNSFENPFDFYKKVNTDTCDLCGTTYHYEIYWGFINVGSAKIEIDSIVEISTTSYAYKIIATAHSNSFIDGIFKVRDTNIAFLDILLKKSYGYYKDINEGNYFLKEYTFFDYNQKKFYGEKSINKKEPKKHSGDIFESVYDVLSSLFLYIGTKDEIKKERSINIITTKPWTLKVINHGIEIVKTEMGKFNTYKLEPKVGEEGIFMSKKGRSLYVYISKNERFPVLLKAEVFIGSVSAKLVKIDKKEKR
ncbi:MAG: DUF3108 domain-containing protein [Elusimicrobiota bacterium]